jgi:hypothetical protein
MASKKQADDIDKRLRAFEKANPPRQFKAPKSKSSMNRFVSGLDRAIDAAEKRAAKRKK